MHSARGSAGEECMDKTRWKSLYIVVQAPFFELILKGAVAGSITALALFWTAVPYVGPYLGIEPSNFAGGLAAALGAVFGIFIAVRAFIPARA